MEEAKNKEIIIQKCFRITHFAARRGRAVLNRDQKEFDRCEAILNDLIKKLVEVTKDE